MIIKTFYISVNALKETDKSIYLMDWYINLTRYSIPNTTKERVDNVSASKSEILVLSLGH